MPSSSGAPELAALEAAVLAYCGRGERAAQPLPLSEALQRTRALINRLEVDFARDAAQFAGAYDENVFINPSPISWLRETCRMTSTAAAAAVCVGRNADRLAESVARANDGRIGMGHLGLMASTAEAIDGSPTATGLFHEGRLLARAQELSVPRFRNLCLHLRHQADRAAFLAERLDDREWRRLELRADGEDGLSISGFLDAEGGAAVRSALEPLAQRGGADDHRAREQRYADALVELCIHALDTGAVPQRASQRSHLQVTTSLETLLGHLGAPAGEMEFAGVIAGVTVQRLACDATITRVLLDARSQVIDVGRSERVVNGATRRALNVRDGGCVWPGCDRQASWTAAHHVVHWVRGGRTDLQNLVLLCHRHHWLVHEGGWQLVRTDDGAILTVPPPVEPLCEARAPDWAAVA